MTPLSHAIYFGQQDQKRLRRSVGVPKSGRK